MNVNEEVKKEKGEGMKKEEQWEGEKVLKVGRLRRQGEKKEEKVEGEEEKRREEKKKGKRSKIFSFLLAGRRV